MMGSSILLGTVFEKPILVAVFDFCQGVIVPDISMVFVTDRECPFICL